MYIVECVEAFPNEYLL